MSKVELEAYKDFSLYAFRTLTPLHVGAGRAVGLVDLPVERDGFGLPTIPSSGIKGALRESFRGDPLEVAIFGSRVGELANVGALTVLDAYLVAIPVRSLRGVWSLATSSFILRRFKEYTDCANISCPEIDKAIKALNTLKCNEAILSKDAANIMKIDEEVIINEEFKLTVRESDELTDLAKKLGLDEPHRLIGVHDDIIRPVVERSLLRRTRIKLEPRTKTVGEGARWTEEDVPMNTVFVTLMAFSRLRISEEKIENMRSEFQKEVKEMQENAQKVREYVEKKLLRNGRGYLILGGHETIGRGLVRLYKVS